MANKAKTVAVIGSGVVGACTARYLQRSGHRVILVDPDPPGEGASFGNAGCFNPSSIVPLAGPDTFKRIPRYLVDPSSPLSIHWPYLPRIAPWLMRFVRAGTPERIKHQARALRSLLSSSLEALDPLVEDANARHLIRKDGILIVYRSENSEAADARAWKLRGEHGVAWEELDRQQLLSFDPNLSPSVRSGKFVPDNGHTVDPGGLVKAIVKSVIESGGKMIKARATGFALDEDRLRAVVTENGEVAADVAVVAAGAYSKPLALAAGDRLPLETERGYHAVIRNSNVVPRVPTTDAERSFVVSPMTEGVRIAGTVELAGLEAPPRWRRSDILLENVGELFPALGKDFQPRDVPVWMGHRPSFPDSLPTIGRSTRCADVIYAFGHGHVGMTAAPHTGIIVTEIVSGRPPPIDLAPFSPKRFQ